MARLTPSERHRIVKLIRKGFNKSYVAKIFGVTRKTVYKWWNRAKKARYFLFRDKKRESIRRKITEKVELSILALRATFKWGCARIQQGLMKLPKFMRDAFEIIVQGAKLSRQAINNLLRKHGLNGYKREQKSWKFFRAKFVDELWQLDIKGYFIVEGKKYWILVCMDDYSRYILLAELFNQDLTTKDVTDSLERLMKKIKRKPKMILIDNGKQFKETWEEWCKSKDIEPKYAHPYYPQDKGKIERAIRNISEEFVKLLKWFPKWLGKLREYVRWYNKDRINRGINCTPAEVYLA